VFVCPPAFCHQQNTVWMKKERKKEKESIEKCERIENIHKIKIFSFYLTMAT
jgi:hypothetical protein